MFPTKPVAQILDLYQNGDIGPTFVIFEPNGFQTFTPVFRYLPDAPDPEVGHQKLSSYFSMYFQNNPTNILKVDFSTVKKDSAKLIHYVRSDSALSSESGNGLGSLQTGSGQTLGLNTLSMILEAERAKSTAEMDRRMLELEHRHRLEKIQTEQTRLERRRRILEEKEKELNKKTFPYQKMLDTSLGRLVDYIASKQPGLAGVLSGSPQSSSESPTSSQPNTFGGQLDAYFNQLNLSEHEFAKIEHDIISAIDRVVAARSSNNSSSTSRAGGEHAAPANYNQHPEPNSPGQTSEFGHD